MMHCFAPWSARRRRAPWLAASLALTAACSDGGEPLIATALDLDRPLRGLVFGDAGLVVGVRSTADAAPVPGARVRVIGLDGVLVEARADAHGELDASDLGPGPFRVELEAEGYERRTWDGVGAWSVALGLDAESNQGGLSSSEAAVTTRLHLSWAHPTDPPLSQYLTIVLAVRGLGPDRYQRAHVRELAGPWEVPIPRGAETVEVTVVVLDGELDGDARLPLGGGWSALPSRAPIDGARVRLAARRELSAAESPLEVRLDEVGHDDLTFRWTDDEAWLAELTDARWSVRARRGEDDPLPLDLGATSTQLTFVRPVPRLPEPSYDLVAGSPTGSWGARSTVVSGPDGLRISPVLRPRLALEDGVGAPDPRATLTSWTVRAPDGARVEVISVLQSSLQERGEPGATSATDMLVAPIDAKAAEAATFRSRP